MFSQNKDMQKYMYCYKLMWTKTTKKQNNGYRVQWEFNLDYHLWAAVQYWAISAQDGSSALSEFLGRTLVCSDKSAQNNQNMWHKLHNSKSFSTIAFISFIWFFLSQFEVLYVTACSNTLFYGFSFQFFLDTVLWLQLSYSWFLRLLRRMRHPWLLPLSRREIGFLTFHNIPISLLWFQNSWRKVDRRFSVPPLLLRKCHRCTSYPPRLARWRPLPQPAGPWSIRVACGCAANCRRWVWWRICLKSVHPAG